VKRTTHRIDPLGRYPAFFAAAAFVAGLLLPEACSCKWSLLVAAAPVAGAITLLRPRAAFVLFLPLGILFSTAPKAADTGRPMPAARGVDVEGVVTRAVRAWSEGSRFTLSLEAVRREGVWETAQGDVLVYTRQRVYGIYTGDRVRLVGASLRPVLPTDGSSPSGYARLLARRGVAAVSRVEGPASIIDFGPSSPLYLPLRKMEELRDGYVRAVRERFTTEAADVLLAVTVGERGGLGYEVRRLFARAGVAHLLAISGLHVAGLAVLLYLLITWLVKRSSRLLMIYPAKSVAALLTMPPLFAYVVLTGMATPATRAFIVVSFYLLSIALGRQHNRLNTLSISALVILALHPWELFELSFQLSFLSVLGILAVHRLLPFKGATAWDRLSTLAKTTFGATAATLPLVMSYFNSLPTLALASNFLCVPLVELWVVPAGLAAFVVWTVWERAAMPFINLALWGADLLLWVVRQVGAVGWAQVAVGPLGWAAWAAYGLMILAVLAALRWKRMAWAAAAAAVLFAGSVLWVRWSASHSSDGVIRFLKLSPRRVVVVARSPSPRVVVWDEGCRWPPASGAAERRVLVGALLSLGASRVDYYAVPARGPAAAAGAGFVLDYMPVKRLLVPEPVLTGRLWRERYAGSLEVVPYANAEAGGAGRTEYEGVSVAAPISTGSWDGTEGPVVGRVEVAGVEVCLLSRGFVRSVRAGRGPFHAEAVANEGIIGCDILYVPLSLGARARRESAETGYSSPVVVRQRRVYYREFRRGERSLGEGRPWRGEVEVVVRDGELVRVRAR